MLNRYWYPILYVANALNNDQYALNIDRTMFQTICYALTREGLSTGFRFVKGNCGPYAGEVKTAIAALSNANLINEIQLGQILVNPQFRFKQSLCTEAELAVIDRTIDLLSRIKNTEQAEIMMTVMFAFDSLQNHGICPTEEDILKYVFDWKKRWIGEKDREVALSIRNLAELKWISPQRSNGLLSVDEDLF